MNQLRKNGIAMIMAIMTIILIATIMALGLAMTTQTTSRNTDLYLSEQAEILADSAREYAMYKIGSTPCIESGYTFIQDNFYNIKIDIKYITTEGCAAVPGATTPTLDYIPTLNANHFDSNLISPVAVINVYVETNTSTTTTSEKISFHKKYIELIKL